ncbi:tetratricopeptide repeat protein [Draconibacterium halophilum]|uniref:Uncharacterized protein n=1 Tax=Draconibacterium halophilum TaxID=2706887 RepID=A0A6C0RD24_9BACT|nr:tetratricopeptide repeat protein [Draconibacterium halophilum]QIA07625.1 hypothetical protein G0Q07_07750 [Draconibacterium halophilum]
MKLTMNILPTIALCLFTFSLAAQANTSIPIEGKWVRMSQTGPVSLEFKNDGTVAVDFNDNQNVDVVTDYKVDKNTVRFDDQEGIMCPESGTYKIIKTDYYLAFDLIDDMCNGRIKMTMGFWTKPNFQDLLEELSQKISISENPDLNLTRARIYLAIGKSKEAKADLDVYIAQYTNDARAYINRAGTRFPADMEGAVSDCNHAIELDPDNKNAWFLRGLARYELGEKEQACADFNRAIELGFSILRIAEKQRCAEIWKE